MAKIQNFLKWTRIEKQLFFEALFWVYLSKLCLLLFSFKYCVRLSASTRNSNAASDKAQLSLIKKALYRASRVTFWKNICLVQSIAARWMLNRRHIQSELKFGVTHDDQKQVIAHAWVKVKDFEVVNKGSDYNELFSF